MQRRWLLRSIVDLGSCREIGLLGWLMLGRFCTDTFSQFIIIIVGSILKLSHVEFNPIFILSIYRVLERSHNQEKVNLKIQSTIKYKMFFKFLYFYVYVILLSISTLIFIIISNADTNTNINTNIILISC